MHTLLKAYTQQAPASRADDTSDAVRRYAPMVYRVVRQVAERLPPSVDREELFSAAMVGLLDALAKFDEKRGIAFEAYARIRIKGAVLDELRNLDHLTRRLRRRSRVISESHKELERSDGEQVSDQAVAAKTGLSVEEVQSGRVQNRAPESFDPSVLEVMDVGMLWEDTATTLDSLEWEERVRLLSHGLADLPERERLVVGLYYEAELTLREISEVMGLTQSRVSQILKKAIDSLRARIVAELS